MQRQIGLMNMAKRTKNHHLLYQIVKEKGGGSRGPCIGLDAS
jgi:hypothetical protein